MAATPESGVAASEVLVAGLRWDGVREVAAAGPADLDLSCVLIGAHGRVLDIVHPGRERSADAAVVHTGDSTTGAGAWDDERVYMFMNALSPAVSTLMLLVASAGDRALADVPNACCHISDYETDEVLLHAPLTDLVGDRACCAASLVRGSAGWRILPGRPDDPYATAIADLLVKHASGKWTVMPASAKHPDEPGLALRPGRARRTPLPSDRDRQG